MLVFEVGHIYFFFKQNEIDGLEKVAVGSNQIHVYYGWLWLSQSRSPYQGYMLLSQSLSLSLSNIALYLVNLQLFFLFCFQHAERWLTKNMTSGSKVEEEYVHKFMFYFFTSWVLKCFSSQMAVLKENLKGLSPLLWNCEIHTAQDMVPMKNVLLGWVQMSNFTWAKLNARVKCMWSATFESIK